MPILFLVPASDFILTTARVSLVRDLDPWPGHIPHQNHDNRMEKVRGVDDF